MLASHAEIPSKMGRNELYSAQVLPLWRNCQGWLRRKGVEDSRQGPRKITLKGSKYNEAAVLFYAVKIAREHKVTGRLLPVSNAKFNSQLERLI